MAAIPWFAYIIVGIIVSVYSHLVLKTTPSYAMRLFFYLGIVFFCIGIYKWLRQRGAPAKSKASQSIAFCKTCGSKNYLTSHYCHICGARIEKHTLRS